MSNHTAPPTDLTATQTIAAPPAPDACCAEAAPQFAAGAPPQSLPPEPRLDMPTPDVAEAAAAASLLADRTRAGILRLLANGPCCVCEMAAALGERQNNVSMHLARLRDAGLVKAVRHSGDARWMFYERDESRCAAAAAALAELLQ
jgi:ArsR family transcriptional regulator